MKTSSLFSLTLIAVLTATAALAQQAPAAATPAASAASGAMADCPKAGMKRHDHGAERNAPSPGAMPCHGGDAASAPDKGASRVPPHDHGKFHKNQ